MAVRQPPRSSALTKWSREPRLACTALTAGEKATSLATGGMAGSTLLGAPQCRYGGATVKCMTFPVALIEFFARVRDPGGRNAKGSPRQVKMADNIGMAAQLAGQSLRFGWYFALNRALDWRTDQLGKTPRYKPTRPVPSLRELL